MKIEKIEIPKVVLSLYKVMIISLDYPIYFSLVKYRDSEYISAELSHDVIPVGAGGIYLSNNLAAKTEEETIQRVKTIILPHFENGTVTKNKMWISPIEE